MPERLGQTIVSTSMITPPLTAPPPPPPAPERIVVVKLPSGGQQPTVTLPTLIVSQLVDYALATLWQADQQEGCCPRCCNPCAALKALLDTGRLDDVARPLGRDSSFWFEAGNCVDRVWLTAAWRMTSCHA